MRLKGGMNLGFGNASEALAPTRGRAIDHIGFELDDLEAFTEQLKEKGIEFDTEFRVIDTLQLNIAYLDRPIWCPHRADRGIRQVLTPEAPTTLR